MDARKITVRAARELTGIAAADFSRIRRVKLDRFTIDRLVAILNKLNRRVVDPGALAEIRYGDERLNSFDWKTRVPSSP